MPSLHLAWALVLWRLARGGPGWLRAAAMGWLVGTVLATFGLGEHYAIDLVVAVPFALVMEAVCRKRLSAFVVANAAAVVAWLVVLRSPEPLASSTIWLGVLATLALSYGLARSLSRPREA